MKKSLPTSKNFLGLEAKYSSYDKSKIVIVQAPYEKTVSYGKGTAKAPKAIIDASQYVEFFDNEFFDELCFKKGIATLPAVDFAKHSGKKALRILEREVGEEIDAKKF